MHIKLYNWTYVKKLQKIGLHSEICMQGIA